MTKLKKSNCDKTQKIKLWEISKLKLRKNSTNCDLTRFKNSNCEKTQLKLRQNSKTQIVTKLKNSSCDISKSQTVTKLKNSNCDKTHFMTNL